MNVFEKISNSNELDAIGHKIAANLNVDYLGRHVLLPNILRFKALPSGLYQAPILACKDHSKFTPLTRIILDSKLLAYR